MNKLLKNRFNSILTSECFCSIPEQLKSSAKILPTEIIQQFN